MTYGHDLLSQPNPYTRISRQRMENIPHQECCSVTAGHKHCKNLRAEVQLVLGLPSHLIQEDMPVICLIFRVPIGIPSADMPNKNSVDVSKN